MALPPADRSLDLDLISPQYGLRLGGSIDLCSIPGMVCPISMEDEDNRYIQDIPGVRSLGIKRDCRNLSHTAPSKLQRISSIATNNDLLQVTKTLKFSSAENPVASLVKVEVETCGRDVERKRPALIALSNLSDRGRIEKEEKLKGLAKVTDRDTFVQCFKSLQEQVAGHIEENKALKEKPVEKDGGITKLRKELTDISTEKETLINQHSKDIEELGTSFRIEKAELEGGNKVLRDLLTEKNGLITKLRKALTDISTEKETLIKQHSKDIEELGTSFRIEKAELEGGNKVLRDLLTEKNGLITQLSREIEVLKTSFSTVKSRVFTAFMKEETQNFSSNAETCGQSVQK